MRAFRAFLIAFVAIAVVSPAFAPAGEFPDDWFYPSDADKKAKHDELVGKPAPPLNLSDWENGQVTAADMKGKIVVVDVWATWCGPCIASIPRNNEVAEKYKDKGVIVVGVCSSNRGQEKMAQVARAKGMKYPTGRDKDLKVQKDWRVMWYPTYAVVDRAGKLRAIGLHPDGMEKVVEKLVAEPASADAGTSSSSSAAAVASIEPQWLEGDRARFASLEGKPVGAFDLTNWTNSSALSAADLKGNVVLIDFWATWCGPCKAAVPHTNEMMEKYGSQGLTIVGVCHPKGHEIMTQTAKELGIKYPIAADAKGDMIKHWKVDGFPDYYLIDRAGNLRIADVKNGKVEEAIQALLAEKSATAQAD
jgi:thiol-disulfide isomerase/thioredoxin